MCDGNKKTEGSVQKPARIQQVKDPKKAAFVGETLSLNTSGGRVVVNFGFSQFKKKICA